MNSKIPASRFYIISKKIPFLSDSPNREDVKTTIKQKKKELQMQLELLESRAQGAT